MDNASRRTFVAGAAAAALVMAFASGSVSAQEPERTLITNARIFDGTSPDLSGPMSVLIEGNKIASIAASITAPQGATVIDAAGKTLMPGLTDCHWHTMQSNTTNGVFLGNGLEYNTLVAAVGAEMALMRGFTTLRDVGGTVFGLKKAIDEGSYIGPRIYPSGAYITQTSGHADFRSPLDVPRDYSRDLTTLELSGVLIVADGRAQVMQRVRENLMKGAAFIKVMAGGGVASPSDPLDVSQYTLEEMAAAVEVAQSWNTYVTVHAYSAKAMQHAMKSETSSMA